MNMTQTTHAFVVNRVRDLSRVRPQLLFGRGESRLAGTACRSHVGADGGAERLQSVSYDGELEFDHAACGAYAEILATKPVPSAISRRLRIIPPPRLADEYGIAHRKSPAAA